MENLSNLTSRRGFILGAAAGGLCGEIACAAAVLPATHDGRLSLFLSDPHVPGVGTRLDTEHVEWDPEYMYKQLAQVIDEALAMRPLPARAVVFGDIAYLRGERADYEKSRPLYERLVAAGVDVVFAMGNHDHRAAFFETYPEWRNRTRVAGEVVSKVSLGDADLLLLDTLTEDASAPGATNPGGGSLSGRQAAWLANEAARATRPFFVGSHHHVSEVASKVAGKSFEDFLLQQPLFRGYVHGHHHFWKTDRLLDWRSYNVRRVATLPSVGFWGDLGYALFRTTPKMAQLRPILREFCFPRHQPDPAKRSATWKAIVADAQNAVCHFPISE